jgi:hypothetical protein
MIITRPWSSPFFPVSTSARTRRFSGGGPPSSPALASHRPGPVLTPDAGPACGVAGDALEFLYKSVRDERPFSGTVSVR